MNKLELQNAIYKQNGYIRNLEVKVKKLKDDKDRSNRDIKKLNEGKNKIESEIDTIVSDMNRKFINFPSNCNASKKITEQFRSIFQGGDVIESINSLSDAKREMEKKFYDIDRELKRVENELRQAKRYRDDLQNQLYQMG